MTVPSAESRDDRLRKLRHELSNPLTAILAEAQLLLMEPSLDPEVAQAIRGIERLSRRMREILQQDQQ